MKKSNTHSPIKQPSTSNGDISPCDDDCGYTTKVLIQAFFPYRRSDRDKLVRQVGKTQITMISAEGLPYGKYPRLIMAYLITEAVKRKNLPKDEARKIPMGASMNDFMRKMGLKNRSTGGTKGTIGILREQMRRIASSTITVKQLLDKNLDKGANLQIVKAWELWYHHNPDQESLDESYIVLSEEFFQEIVNHPIPINLGILKALSKPRSMDLYVWATTRKYQLGHPLALSWQQVFTQFNDQYPNTSQGLASFKVGFKKAIAEVQALWPGVGLDITKEGIILHPGQPSINPRKNKELP